MEGDSEIEKEKQRLMTSWEEQLQRMKQSKQDRISHAERILVVSPRRDEENCFTDESVKEAKKSLNRIIKIEASEKDTVGQLKEKVSKTLGILVHNLSLCFEGRDLVDEGPEYKGTTVVSLCNYGVRHSDVIQVTDMTSGEEYVIKVVFIEKESTHAMVVLGCCTEKGGGRDGKSYRRLYMLWNWWESMPLVLVSFEYLVSSRCKIYFVRRKLTDRDVKEVQHTEALAVDCAFPDHGENGAPRIHFTCTPDE